MTTAILVFLATVAISSLVAAAFIRSHVLCIVVTAVLAELLFGLYTVLWYALSDHPPTAHSAARGLAVTVVFGAPFFFGAAAVFTLLARRLFGKNRN